MAPRFPAGPVTALALAGACRSVRSPWRNVHVDPEDALRVGRTVARLVVSR